MLHLINYFFFFAVSNLTDLEDVLNRWHFYGEIFRNPDNGQTTTVTKKQYELEPGPLLLHETETAIKKLKFRKASGIDAISAEPAAKPALHQLFFADLEKQ